MIARGLRDAVLAGRFFGPQAGGAAEDLATFLVEAEAGVALRAWFGGAVLAGLGDSSDQEESPERLRLALDRDIARLDVLIGAQLDAVLHHDSLRRLEGSWRGLDWLVRGLPAKDRRLKVRLLPLHWQELYRDFERAGDVEQSVLFQLIYEEEFGRPGGEPFNMIAADFEVAHVPESDLFALSRLANIAAAAFAPTLIGCSPALLGLDDFAEAGPAFDPTDTLRLPDRVGFARLRERSDTRFLALALPRLLARAPWPEDGARPDGFRYRENAPDAAARVWVSPVYAMAVVVARAFLQHGWPADIRGAEPSEEVSGGVVPAPAWERLPGDPPGEGGPPRPQLEVAFTDLQERQLADAGLLVLAGLDGLPEAAFAAVPSLYRPQRMANAPVAEANQRLSAQFNAILCVSRIAHCVKIIGRELVGAYRTSEEIQQALREWLANFTNHMESGADTAHKYPLREASVEIREQPGKPGVFGCVMHLRPQYQLDEIGAVFRLVTDLQAPRAAA